MPEASAIRVTLSLQAFRTLLQRGVGIHVGNPAPVREFLQDALGIDPGYVEERLQTAFLNGQPVDDFDRTVVGPGAVLALSGAMPGLAGATMRRGGYYARLREGITHQGNDEAVEKNQDGIVIVKLFNRPLADLARDLSTRLLLFPADALDAILAEDPPNADPTDGDWIPVHVTLTGEGQP